MTTAAKSAQAQVNGSSGVGSERRPVTVPDFLAAKTRGLRLTMLTAYDYTMARLVDAAGIDGVLVGDSLGMVVQGHDNSLTVTLEEVLYHTRLVARGLCHSLLVADMPFMTYQINAEQAVTNAGRLIKEGQAHAVKLEGGVRTATTIAAITAIDIPVMAHIGLTPQSVLRLGGFRVQRDEGRLLEDALAVQEAGAFAVVLECLPAVLAQKITNTLKIPTIGIGAGAGCDGQILVTHDALGLYDDLRPRFVKQYADLGRQVRHAVENYCRDVREGKFPAPEHEFR